MIIIKHQKAVHATSHLPGWMMGTISVGIRVRGHHGALCRDRRLKMPPRMCYYKVSWISILYVNSSAFKFCRNLKLNQWRMQTSAGNSVGGCGFRQNGAKFTIVQFHIPLTLEYYKAKFLPARLSDDSGFVRRPSNMDLRKFIQNLPRKLHYRAELEPSTLDLFNWISRGSRSPRLAEPNF